MKSQAIISAAGIGQRLNHPVTKTLIPLKGKALFLYSLETFIRSPLVDSVVVVAHQQYIEDFEKVIEECGFTKPIKVVPGGVTRCQSVFNGLQALDSDTDIVLIHDGARPFVSLSVVEAALMACRDGYSVVAAVPVKSTIKRVNPQDHIIEATLNRDVLWEIQTPQVFRKKIILKAHAKNEDVQATDDAILVERIQEEVKVINGEYTNIKITTQEDLVIAEAFLDNEETMLKR